MARRQSRILWALVCGCLAFAPSIPAAAQQSPREGVDYRLIPPQPAATGNKIEVIEFFWYGCPFCNELEPALEKWLKNKPADVEFRLIPAILHDNWAPHARIYYTLAALGELQRLHAQVYYGYHVEQLYMSKPDVMEKWAVDHGIDREKWLAAYNSPEVAAQVEQAKQLRVQYNVNATPSLIVDGRYLTSGGMVNELPDLLPIVDGLIRKARDERAARAVRAAQK